MRARYPGSRLLQSGLVPQQPLPARIFKKLRSSADLGSVVDVASVAAAEVSYKEIQVLDGCDNGGGIGYTCCKQAKRVFKTCAYG